MGYMHVHYHEGISLDPAKKRKYSSDFNPDTAVIQSIYFLAYCLPESGTWCYSRLKDARMQEEKNRINIP